MDMGKVIVMRLPSVLLVSLLLASVLLGGNDSSARASNSNLVEILVKLRHPVQPAVVEQFAEKYNGQRRTEVAALGVHVLRFPTHTDVDTLLKRMRVDVSIAYAEPNAIARASFIPNDPAYASQWGLDRTRAAAGWDIQPGTSNTLIAVVDTGADPDHPDLQSKRVLGWNYDASSPGYNTPTTNDDNGHGTHVAGIAVAATHNNIGGAGMCPNCSFMAVKVLGANGSGTYDAVASGIIFAADQGAQIINLSLSGTMPSQTLQDAVTYASNKGALLVAAAGNDGSSTPNYPAAYADVMAVAATDSTDQRANFSSYNSYISVAAPGVNMYSTYWSATAGSSYTYLSGTSMATPFVSGLAGLLLSQDATWSAADVRQMVERSAADVGTIGWDQYTGYGRIDVLRAFTGSLSGTATDAGTGNPLASAQITVLQDGQVVGTTITAADGSYRVQTLRPGSYDVRISLSGYTSQTRTGVVVAAAQDTSTVSFSLAHVGTIAGRVSFGRKVIVGAVVQAAQGGQLLGTATSDSTGNYVINNLDAGTYTVTATATGYQSQTKTIVVTAGETTSGVNFSLKK